MDTNLTIHCVGLQGLTITVSGADHSIPMTTDMLRVTTILGSADYNILALPISYKTAELNGNLIISDVSGKALYRWKSHATVRPSTPEPRQCGSQSGNNSEEERQSPFMSAPPSYRTAETPLSSRSARASNGLNNRQKASADVGAMAEDVNRNVRLRPGKRRTVTQLEPSLTRPRTNIIEDDPASSLPVRPKRKAKWKCKGKVDMTEDSGETDSSGSDMPFVRKRRSKSRDRPRLEGLSYKDSKIPGTIILFNRLVEENEEDSEPFAEPVDPVAENVPDYHQVIKRPMDLRTLKENLGKGLYTTVKDFESDFELMIENSIRFNGLTHSVSQGGLRLFEAFKVLMASSRGCK